MKLYFALVILGLALTGHISVQSVNAAPAASTPPPVASEETEAPADLEDPETTQPQKLVAELRIFVDHMVATRYAVHTKVGEDIKKKIENDIRVIINEVNTNYLSTLNGGGVHLETRVKKIEFWDETSTFYTAAELQSTKVLIHDVFSRFVNHVRTTTPFTQQYDYNLLYTGYDLGTSSDIIYSGTSYTDSICNPFSNMGILTFEGHQRSAQRTAASIVRSLAKHEPRCNNAGAYVDGSPSLSSPTRFEFSPCIIDKIKAKLIEFNSGTHGINCMTEQYTTVGEPTSIEDLDNSDIFNVDSLCKRYSRGKATTIGVCTYFTPYGSDSMCQRLYCYGDSTCHIYPPMEGMVCGHDDKRCKKGKCMKLD